MNSKFYLNTKYEIYEDGQCYSHLSNKFLTPQMSNKYSTYNLTLNKKKKKTYVHRMVAETFLPHNEEHDIVNHKDGNKLNNLEKITYRENNLHVVYTIRTNKCAKVIMQIDKNGKIVQEFVSVAQASKNTGINNISRAVNSGRTVGGFYWKYITNN